MNIVTSEELNKCLEYSDNPNIEASDYGTLIRAMVYTMNKELPVEIMKVEAYSIIKAQLQHFSIGYTEGQEGSNDSIKMKFILLDEGGSETLDLEGLSKSDVKKDKKSGTRTFYRYYINLGGKSLRFTFNRRISKA